MCLILRSIFWLLISPKQKWQQFYWFVPSASCSLDKWQPSSFPCSPLPILSHRCSSSDTGQLVPIRHRHIQGQWESQNGRSTLLTTKVTVLTSALPSPYPQSSLWSSPPPWPDLPGSDFSITLGISCLFHTYYIMLVYFQFLVTFIFWWVFFCVRYLTNYFTIPINQRISKCVSYSCNVMLFIKRNELEIFDNNESSILKEKKWNIKEVIWVWLHFHEILE